MNVRSIKPCIPELLVTEKYTQIQAEMDENQGLIKTDVHNLLAGQFTPQVVPTALWLWPREAFRHPESSAGAT